jgi:hypothetical protein
MTSVRPTKARRFRRAAYLASATAMCGTSLVLAAPGIASAAPIFTAGNLLVSTSEYTDLPTITAGSTVLPIAATTFTISGVTTSVTGPPYTVTVTTTAKSGYVPGQTVVISGVGGATEVNGTQVIVSTPTTTTFTISLPSVPAAYTSGGSVIGNIAIAGAQYPQTFNNDLVDANFGITEPIFLDQVPATTSLVTTPISTIEVPNSDTNPSGDQLVTSFSSKSELALNQSTDGQYVSFVGYHAPTAAIDVSDANTPNEQDSTNTDTANGGVGYYRDAAVMNDSGNFQFTETGAYSGDNGRAAIFDPANNTIFMAGNAGNGGKPTYQGVVIGAGSQITTEASTSEAAQDASVAAPTPYGSFNIKQLGDAADKSSKDDNFRGLTEYNGVIYLSKGSGSNGVNTVYFVDTTGNACPSGGVGVPQTGASLPSASSWAQTSNPLYPQFYNGTTTNSLGENTANPGLTPSNMCILNGFSTTLAAATTGTIYYPFGLWFANPTTLYVADEGSGAGGSTDTTGGLQKWTLNTSTNTWSLQYTLNSGLNLQQTYSVNPSPAGINGGSAGQTYPTGANSVGGQTGSWAPATDGLRNIVGQVNGNGTVTVWATTSTISGSGDQGADPNQVVAITDSLSATGPTAPASETFSQVMAPTDGVVYRGVSFTPTTSVPNVLPEVPWLPLLPVAGGAIVGGYLLVSRRRKGSVAIS